MKTANGHEKKGRWARVEPVHRYRDHAANQYGEEKHQPSDNIEDYHDIFLSIRTREESTVDAVLSADRWRRLKVIRALNILMVRKKRLGTQTAGTQPRGAPREQGRQAA
jgi:hypothetical protein